MVAGGVRQRAPGRLRTACNPQKFTMTGAPQRIRLRCESDNKRGCRSIGKPVTLSIPCRFRDGGGCLPPFRRERERVGQASCWLCVRDDGNGWPAPNADITPRLESSALPTCETRAMKTQQTESLARHGSKTTCRLRRLSPEHVPSHEARSEGRM